MADWTYGRLRRENDGLRELVMQLSTIVLKSLVDQRRLSELYGGEAHPQLPQAMSPIEIAARLREAATRCANRSRGCADNRIGRELESLSVELAAVAERIKVLIAGDV